VCKGKRKRKKRVEKKASLEHRGGIRDKDVVNRRPGGIKGAVCKDTAVQMIRQGDEG